MKKFLSLALVFTLLLSTFAMLSVSSSAEDVTLIAKGSEWEYLAYEDATTAAPEGWLTGEDTAEWSTGTAPFGEGRTTDFGYANYVAYLRTTFTVEDASAYAALTLSIIYDEDPVVYLNGTEIMSATGYKDSAYTDFVVDASLLVDGENIVCVKFSEAYGGSLLDLALTAKDSVINSDGSIVTAGATKEGFADFGGTNAATNVLDGDNSSCCGSGWNAGTTQAVTVIFAAPVMLDKVTVSCKNEGAPAEGAWGTYDVYAVDGETETKIGTVDAYPDGRSVELAEAVKASAVKVVITSWNGSAWAAIADIWAYGSAIEAAPEGPEVIKIASWWNIGWENWKNSPNNPNGAGAEPGVTQMLVEIADADGAAI
ncbi:MAG: discoidin domain-containing protein, partial [Clostridia bacterium]|nr:discoidin domain-containing protein [Clostridia bacterium]